MIQVSEFLKCPKETGVRNSYNYCYELGSMMVCLGMIYNASDFLKEREIEKLSFTFFIVIFFR
jgi:hypothetical protein